jgi:hypothetical protein
MPPVRELRRWRDCPGSQLAGARLESGDTEPVVLFGRAAEPPFAVNRRTGGAIHLDHRRGRPSGWPSGSGAGRRQLVLAARPFGCLPGPNGRGISFLRHCIPAPCMTCGKAGKEGPLARYPLAGGRVRSTMRLRTRVRPDPAADLPVTGDLELPAPARLALTAGWNLAESLGLPLLGYAVRTAGRAGTGHGGGRGSDMADRRLAEGADRQHPPPAGGLGPGHGRKAPPSARLNHRAAPSRAGRGRPAALVGLACRRSPEPAPGTAYGAQRLVWAPGRG